MEPLVSVQNLKVAFRLDRAHTFEAVKGISFDIPMNSTVALVGESGSGKSVTALSILGLLPPENSIIDPASRIMFARPQRRRAAARRSAQSARRGDLDDLPGADDVAEPGVHRRLSADRGAAAAHGNVAGGGAQAGGRAARRGRHPRSRVQGQRLSVADVGRPAAARDDRDGDRLRAEAPDRRRAHDRARRHDPEADPRPHRRAAEEAPDVGALHHARPRGRRRDRRPRRRDAQRRDQGAGPGEARVRASAGRLHERAAAMPAAPRPPSGAPAGDRGLHGRRRARDEPDRAAARHRRRATRSSSTSRTSARISIRARASSAGASSRR